MHRVKHRRDYSRYSTNTPARRELSPAWPTHYAHTPACSVSSLRTDLDMKEDDFHGYSLRKSANVQAVDLMNNALAALGTRRRPGNILKIWERRDQLVSGDSSNPSHELQGW